MFLLSHLSGINISVAMSGFLISLGTQQTMTNAASMRLDCLLYWHIHVLQEATPEMEELSLLRDAIKQLDELFLLVVVGEFNSGKSSIINALLGGRFLAEGILPTTNEISVLKHRSASCQESVLCTTQGCICF